MPMIRVECPFCGYQGKANLKLVGHEVGCRECGERFEIPLVPVVSKAKEGSGVWKPIGEGFDINALAELEKSSGQTGPVKVEDEKRRRRQKMQEPNPKEKAETVLPPALKAPKAPANPFAPPVDTVAEAAAAQASGGSVVNEAAPATAGQKKPGKGAVIVIVVVVALLVAAAGAAAVVMMGMQA